MREMRERSCYIMQSKMLLLLLEYFPRNWAYLFAAFLLYRQKQHANRCISFWIIFSVSRCSAAVAYLSRCNWYYCSKHKNDLLACFTRILSIKIQTFNTLFVFNVYPRNVFMIDMLTNHVRHLTSYIFLIIYTPTFATCLLLLLIS